MSTTKRKSVRQSLAEPLEIRRFLAAGDLDRTFGNNGVGGLIGLGEVADLAVAPAEKIVTLAFGQVQRLNPDGTRDNTLDGDGAVSTPHELHRAIAVQRDGKILLGGSVNGMFAVARLNADGTLDRSFSGDGISIAQFIPGGRGEVADLLIRPDGKIVAVGAAATVADIRGEPQAFAAVIARFNADGSLDGSFSGDGKASPGRFGVRHDSATSVALTPDGRIVMSVFSIQHGYKDNYLFRFTKSGQLDTSFSGDGRLPLDSTSGQGVETVAVQSTGKVLYLINYEPRISLVRLNANGTPDGSFIRQDDFLDLTRTIGLARDLVVLPDDRIAVAGGGRRTTGQDDMLALARFLPNGQRDPAFNGGQTVYHHFMGGCGMSGHASALAFDPSGFLIVGGVGTIGDLCAEFPVVLRYHNDDATPPDIQQPFTGTPYTINQTIEAENFDRGGQGVAYRDQEPQNLGGVYRPTEGVDIHANNDGGNGFNIGWVNNDEYLEYTINVPQTGSYVFDARVATPKNGARLLFSLNSAPQIDVAVPNAGSFANWRTINTNQVSLPAGTHVLRVTFNGPTNIGGLTNLNWLRIRPADGGGGGEGQAGDLDRSFTGDGLLETNFGFGAPARIIDAVTDSSGRILVSASAIINERNTHLVARFLPNGSLDQTFGVNGRAVIELGGSSLAGDIELAPDGRIIVAGHAFGTVYVARLLSNGSLDSSFNPQGTGSDIPGIATTFSPVDFGADLEIQPDGKVLIGGSDRDVNPTFHITRLTATGQIDSGFGRAGRAVIEMDPARGSDDYLLGIEMMPDGRIVAGGVTRLSSGASGFAVARLNPNGTPDTTYFGGRAYIVDPSPGFDAALVRGSFELQGDGRAVIVAATALDPNLTVFRFTDRARPDTTFGNNGLATTNLGVIPHDLEIARDGKLVIAGGTLLNFNGDFRVVRLTSAGQPDATFRQDPSTSNTAGHQLFDGVFIQNDGNLIATGHTTVDGERLGVIARYLGAGAQQPPPTGQQSPFRGTPFNINEVIQAEDFDNGGEGVAYHDQEAANLGGVNYRPGLGVDILNTTDEGGGRKVGYWQTSDWLEYTIHVPTAGQYVLQTRIATPKTGGLLTYALNGDILTGTRLAEVQIPNTGNFNRFQTVSSPAVTLPAGTHVLHVHPYSGNPGGVADVNWFRIVPA